MGTTRFTVGDKGVSRVTVYRRSSSPGIYIEWWDDDGRHRKALKDFRGNRVTSWDDAKEIAKEFSRTQEKRRNLLGAEFFGIDSGEARTLSDLFERRHDDLGPDWSPKYAKSRDRRKTFWIERLGARTPLSAITAAAVERVAKEAQAKKSDRWRQDVLRYIVDSFAYAEKKLKWIEAKHNLSAVDIPSAKGESRAYSLAEARKLLPALYGVDPRAGWMGTVAFQTGRRIGAILALGPDDVRTEDELTVIQFAGETDKARKTGEAVVHGLPERTDWRPVAPEDANQWIHDAEAAAGVPHVSGRAWHGLKRLYATLTTALPGADKQSGTLKTTLEGHYRQDLLEPKVEVAKALADRLDNRGVK